MTESIPHDRSYEEIFNEETLNLSTAIERVLNRYRDEVGATEVEIEYIKASTALAGIEQRLKHGVGVGQSSDSGEQKARLRLQKDRLDKYAKHLRNQITNPGNDSLPWHFPVASLLDNVASLAEERGHSFNEHRTQVIVSQNFLPTFEFEI